MKQIKKVSFKIYAILFAVFFSLLAAIYINYSFGFKRIEIEFFEQSQNLQENQDIKNYIEREVRKNSKTLLNIIFLDNGLITKLTRDEYELVNRIDIDKKLYFNNLHDFGVKLYAVVIKNDEFFFACVEEKSRENFLVWSMLGNSDGEFYKEIDESVCEPGHKGSERQSLIKFTLHPKSLFSKQDQEKVSGADSLSGMRIYRSKDFGVLKEIIFYLQKNSFEIKEIYINELRLVDINLGDYVLKINLDREPKQTVDDFETISRAGKLQKYINDDKDAIDYIDLTFKNKVFFKLKGDKKIEEENGIIASTTKQDAKELLD